ncbi:DUF3857 domain-containing protein [Marivirga sp. S37H4]|uniref:DUF3857 domain-containing protein n=1 Tax=Marivirga aurantiaca TaxID=2802615 RepID=A0A935C747_9BACT|nr:DUF3857 domain-containing protein [Marivirga aurantiaca]MBK6264791.1 DUF3857 domain-containing protein [Marivirga aurantiaca]
MRLFLFSFFLFIYSSQLFSQEIKIGKRPAWTTPINWIDDSEKPYTSKDLHYLLTSEQYNIEKKEEYNKIVYKILNSNGVSEGASVQILFDPLYQEVFIHHIRKIRSGEKPITLTPDFLVLQREGNAERNVYDGTNTAIMNLKDVRVDDIIEIEYSIRGQNPLYEGLFSKAYNLASYYSIAHQNIRILGKKDTKLRIYSPYSTQYSPIYKDRNVIYDINIKQTEGVKYDDQAPSWFNFSNFVIFTEFDKTKFSNWITKLFSISSREYNSAAQKAQELTGHIENERTKIEILINFVQDEIRYLSLSTGIGAYKPRGPSDVLKDRFGDCKDKSLLLSTMLNSIGVNAFPVLVNSYKGQYITDYPLTPQIFDHCVVKLEKDNQSFWVDPTINNQEGSLSKLYFPNYGAGFIITDTTQKMVEIPFLNHSRTEITHNYYLRGSNDPVEFEVETEYYGKNADQQREYFENADISDIENNYLEHYERFNYEVVLSEEIKTKSYDETNMYRVSENYRINNFWVNSEKQPIREKPIYAEIIFDNMIWDFQKRRNSPLALNYPTEIIQRIYIHMPTKINVPSDWQEIKNDFFQFSRSLNYQNNIITFTCKFKILSDHVPLQQIDLYKNDIEKASNLVGIEVYPPAKSSYKEATYPQFNWFFLIGGVIIFGVFTYLAILLNKKYDPPSKHYKYRYEKIEGILWLVFIGLLIAPIITISNLFNGVYFDNSIWMSLIMPDSLRFNPIVAFIIMIDYVIVIFHLVFCGLIIIQFLKKRSSLRILITVLYAFNLSYAMLLIIMQEIIGLGVNTDPYLGFLKALIAAAIWIPFFQISNRAKETFVYQRMPKNAESDQNFPMFPNRNKDFTS